MSKPRMTYDELLLAEEALKKRLSNRIVKTGQTAGGAPIERDADPKVTTELRTQLESIIQEKQKLKDGLDPMERMAYDLYESFLKKRSKGE